MIEIWKDVVGFEGFYQVSNIGRVKRIPHDSVSGANKKQHIKERIKVIGNDKDGYETVMLYKGSDIKKLCKIHRLVAEAFIPNPNNYPMINHKDEVKNNNTVSNLEWCNCTYNNNYGTRNIRISTNKKGHVCQVKKDATTGKFIKGEKQ